MRPVASHTRPLGNVGVSQNRSRCFTLRAAPDQNDLSLPGLRENSRINGSIRSVEHNDPPPLLP